MAAPSMLPAPAPARGYIRVYLLTWGVLASAGLGYLGSLAWQPDLFRATPAPPPAEVEEGLRLANHALSEVGNARREIGEVRQDLGELRTAGGYAVACAEGSGIKTNAIRRRLPTTLR